MSLTKLTDNLNNIGSLADKPSMESSALKQLFDKAGNDIKTYINQVLTEELDTLISGNYTTLNNMIIANASTITSAQLDKIYPVGSIYMSVNATNPSQLMGGTWEKLKDRFLLGSGDTYSSGATGGEATHTLTTGEMPIHTHTFTGVAHNHGLNSHTHTYTKANTSTGSTALTINQIPSHDHGIFSTVAKLGTAGYYVNTSGTTKIGDATISKTVTTGGSQGHTHTIGGTTANTGASSGNTANATATGTNSNAGSGQAHNNMPPYLVVNMWKRIS